MIMPKKIKPPKGITLTAGTEKKMVERGVEINGTTRKLQVEVSYNNAKGTFKILPKITTEMVTGDSVKDQALLKTLNSMIEYAMKVANQWRDEWLAGQQEDHGAQMSIPTSSSDEDFEGSI